MEKNQIPSLNLDPNFERAMKIIAQTEISTEDRKKLMKPKYQEEETAGKGKIGFKGKSRKKSN